MNSSIHDYSKKRAVRDLVRLGFASSPNKSYVDGNKEEIETSIPTLFSTSMFYDYVRIDKKLCLFLSAPWKWKHIPPQMDYAERLLLCVVD